jgi:hypothetical protein
MKPTKLIAALTATTAALAMASALALELPTFDELDADGDGFINRSEAGVLPCLARHYDEAERSDERGLNPAEYRQALERFCR